MFNRQLFENSRSDGFGVLEIVGPVERPDAPARPTFVPLTRTELRGAVTGPVAGLRLTQVFRYTSEQCPRVLEALYRFPLPGDAAVTGLTVRFGDVEIVAELAERASAEREYQRARNEGRQATLLTRESPDVFTLQIAGLQPELEVRIETSYVQLARAEEAGWSLRLPLTTAPRYVRDDERGSPFERGQPLALLRDPGHRFALDLRLEAAASAASPTHPLLVSEDGVSLKIRLRDGEVLPDRDFVLSWQPLRAADRAVARVLLQDDPAQAETYFLTTVAPPTAPLPEQLAPREILLLIDHSGSMEGAKWQAADWAVKRFLSELGPLDTFNLGLFHNTTRWFAERPLAAAAATVARAIDFLERERDSGGTELGVALEQALEQARTPGERARHILVVTDAQVSDLGRLLELIDREARRADRRRVSALCIDAAPNSTLVLELAERGGGLARFLTSAPEEEDITTALDELLADWSAPVQLGLRLSLNRPSVQTGSQATTPSADGWSAIELGDLPSGRSIWVAGRVARAGADLAFRLTNAAGQTLPVQGEVQAAGPAVGPLIPALFGGRRVLELELIAAAGQPVEERLRRLGYDPADLPSTMDQTPIYPENARSRSAEAVRTLLVREALHYGIACSETAFVASRTEAGRLVEATVAVASALPAGWSDRFASGPPMGQPLTFAPAYLAAPPSAPPGSYGPSAGFARPTLGRPQSLGSRLRSWLPGGRGADGVPIAAMGPVSQSQGQPQPQPSATVIFTGVPRFAGGESVLLESAAGGPGLAGLDSIQKLVLRFPAGGPAGLDRGLVLLIFVDDLATPRARVRIADLVRQGGARPLNLRCRSGQAVRIVLQDPAGTWSANAPAIEVSLG